MLAFAALRGGRNRRSWGNPPITDNHYDNHAYARDRTNAAGLASVLPLCYPDKLEVTGDKITYQLNMTSLLTESLN